MTDQESQNTKNILSRFSLPISLMYLLAFSFFELEEWSYHRKIHNAKDKSDCWKFLINAVAIVIHTKCDRCRFNKLQSKKKNNNVDLNMF